MEGNRKSKLKEKVTIAIGAIGAIAITFVAGAYVYSKGRDDQLTADAKSLYALEQAGVIKLELPEDTNTTT